MILTSADVREEIDSLPNSTEIYNFVRQLHGVIIKFYQKSFDNKANNIYGKLLAFLWRGLPIDEDKQRLFDLGWTQQDIETYRSKIVGSELALDSYISHLVEISDIERIRIDYKEIWLPLKEEYEAVFNNNLKE